LARAEAPGPSLPRPEDLRVAGPIERIQSDAGSVEMTFRSTDNHPLLTKA